MNQVLERVVQINGKNMRIVLVDRWYINESDNDAHESYITSIIPI